MTDEEYNGWPNYETWAFWNNVINDEGLYHMLNERTEAIIKADTEIDDGGLGRAVIEELWETFPAELREEIGSQWRIDTVNIGEAARESFQGG